MKLSPFDGRHQTGTRSIGKLYAVEKHIREAGLVGEARRAHRLAQAKPVAHQFFAWIDAQFESQGLVPSLPLTSAMAYVRERRAASSVGHTHYGRQ